MLNLNDLGNGSIPGITESLGAAMAEAGGVCLESQGHAPGIRLSIRGYSANIYFLEWPAISDQSRRAWNNADEATEYGASSVAALLVTRETGYTIIERSQNGTGVDYWLGDGRNPLPFERKARLEVSGIRQGSEGVVIARVMRKLSQTGQSDNTGLPVYVIVVEFGRPIAEIREK